MSTHGRSNPRQTHAPRRPTASVVEYRRPLFAVSRMRVIDGGQPEDIGTDVWGRVRVVRGGVTQHHRDLLDVIRAVAEHRVMDSAGQEHLIFDDAKVRKILGSDIDWRDLKDDLHDLLHTVVQISGDRPGSWGAAFPLATFVGDANSKAVRAPGQYPAQMRRLVLSTGFTMLLERHTTITLSREVLSKVLALPHAVARAVARWCLTHSGEQHHDLAVVLAAVGAIRPGEPISGRAAASQAREYVTQLRKCAPDLADLGIEIDGLRLHYRRQGGVFIAGVPEKTEGVPEKTEGVPEKTEGVPEKTEGSKGISHKGNSVKGAKGV